MVTDIVYISYMFPCRNTWYKKNRINPKPTKHNQLFSLQSSNHFISPSSPESSSSSSLLHSTNESSYNNENDDNKADAHSPSSSSSAMPYFPLTIEEMAYDASYYIKIALMNRYSRIRIDTRMVIIKKDRHNIRWLILLAKSMIDTQITQIRIFIDKVYIELCQMIIAELNVQNIVNVCPISDDFIANPCHDKLFIVFQPNNMICHSKSENVLEDVQAICFQSALKGIPVLLINPVLISTSYSTFGSTTSMLLGDFIQAYFIRDDYVMLAQSGRCCGLVRRLTAGCDLYLLERVAAAVVVGSDTTTTPTSTPAVIVSSLMDTKLCLSDTSPVQIPLSPSSTSTQKSTRLMHWSSQSPENLKSQIARLIAGEFNYAKTIRQTQNLKLEKDIVYNIRNSFSNQKDYRRNGSSNDEDDAFESSPQQSQSQSQVHQKINLNEYISSTGKIGRMIGEWRSTLPPPPY